MGKFDGVLIASDYDNTIVYTEDSLRGKGGIPPVSPENRAAMEYFMAQGGTFCVSTGRALPSFAALKDGIPMNGPTVLFNGAAIYDFAAGRYLCTAFLPDSIRQDLHAVELAFPSLAAEIYHDGSQIHTLHPNALTRNHMALTHSAATEADSILQVPMPISKVLFEETGQRGLEVVRSGKFFLEITAKGATKGAMTQKLASLLGIRAENVCCVGDQANDLTMLASAGHAFAPANAIEAVRRAPGIELLPDCREDALAALIDRLDGLYA